MEHRKGVKMKAIKIEEVNGETEITVETGKWIFKKETIYRTAGNSVADYFNWVKMPEKQIVPDRMSFQLDTWKKLGMQ